VLWAWGLNGVASVVGSVGCILLAHSVGFDAALRAAAAVYLGALLALTRAWRQFARL